MSGQQNFVDVEYFTQRRKSRILYKSVTSFQDLIDLNVCFLRGELSWTPYHDGPIFEETLPLLQNLIRINEAGFLSVEGQPGTLTPTIEQKSYIVGLVPRNIAQRLKIYLLTKPVYFEMYSMNPYVKIADTYPTREYVLTQYRESIDESFSADTVRTPRESAEELEAQAGFFLFPHIVQLLETDCIHVGIACKEFGQGSVEDILMEFFYGSRATCNVQ